jgi:hypothetical protein
MTCSNDWIYPTSARVHANYGNADAAQQQAFLTDLKQTLTASPAPLMRW